MPRSVLGLDIGGANLKAAHSEGGAWLTPFELWKSPARLPSALRALVEPLPPSELLAVTMTGELCDCFETRRQGVHAILDAVEGAARRARVVVWQSDGRLVDLNVARRTPLLAASANWLALATYAGRHAPHGSALLIDIGSTTTDLVPLRDGRPIHRGRTDQERLAEGELVYLGVRRTPVCAFMGPDQVAEVFATSHDAYVLLGLIPEDECDCGTADGRPATRVYAHARLARMLGTDGESCPEEGTEALAEQTCRGQLDRIRRGLKRVLMGSNLSTPLSTAIVSGSGEFLARIAIEGMSEVRTAQVLSLSEALGPAISPAACAYALAVLAAERAEP